MFPPSEVVEDAEAIRLALKDLPNDIHPLPSTNSSTAKRILNSCVPAKDPAVRRAVPGQTGGADRAGHEKVREVRLRVRGVLPEGARAAQAEAPEETVTG